MLVEETRQLYSNARPVFRGSLQHASLEWQWLTNNNMLTYRYREQEQQQTFRPMF